MSFLPPNHSNGNGKHPAQPGFNGNGRSDKPSESQPEALDNQLNEPSHAARDGAAEQGSREQGVKPIPIAAKPLDEARVRAIKRQANRFYLILVLIGLTIGLITSVGVVAVIQRLGLTEVVPIGEPRSAPD
jgi:hypothetical protein